MSRQGSRRSLALGARPRCRARVARRRRIGRAPTGGDVIDRTREAHWGWGRCSARRRGSRLGRARIRRDGTGAAPPVHRRLGNHQIASCVRNVRVACALARRKVFGLLRRRGRRAGVPATSRRGRGATDTEQRERLRSVLLTRWGVARIPHVRGKNPRESIRPRGYAASSHRDPTHQWRHLAARRYDHILFGPEHEGNACCVCRKPGELPRS